MTTPSAEPTTKLSARLHSYALNLALWTDDAKLDELAALLQLAASQVEALEKERDELRERLSMVTKDYL